MTVLRDLAIAAHPYGLRVERCPALTYDCGHKLSLGYP